MIHEKSRLINIAPDLLLSDNSEMRGICYMSRVIVYDKSDIFFFPTSRIESITTYPRKHTFQHPLSVSAIASLLNEI